MKAVSEFHSALIFIMKKNDRNIVIIALTIFMIVIWISSNIYHIAVTSTVPENLRETITPFNPVIDLKTLEKLKSKRSVQEFSVTTETKLNINSTESTKSGSEASSSATN
jgi:hypothetical protein